MIYLTLKMWLCLLLAALIGLIVGWWLYRSRAVKRELELNNEIEVRKDSIGSLEGQLSARDTQIVSLGSDLEQWQAKVPGLESTLAQRDDQVMGLTMDLDSWKQKVPVLETQLDEAGSQRVQLETDLAGHAKSLLDRDGDVDRLNGEVSSLRKSLAAVNARQSQEASDFNSELSGQKQQMDGLRRELESAAAAHLQEQESALSLTGKAADLHNEIEALKRHGDSLTTEGREREQALAKLRQSLKSQEAERLSLAEQVTALSPVALRVTSQDQSISSLNQDLRNRDTTINGLKSEIDASLSQAEQLKSSEQSLGLLRAEMDGMRGELTGARTALSDASAGAQAKANSKDTEWRARLRIADSGRQQAQADLYRRQEQIDRLERQIAASEQVAVAKQIAAAKSEAAILTAAARRASAQRPAAQVAAQGLVGTSGLNSRPAGRVAVTDERQWKSRLRIEESARRKAEADALRGAQRVLSLEAQLRQAVAGAQSHTRATARASTITSPAVSLPTEAESLTSTRFLTSAPNEIDELQKIKGVGKVVEKTLNSLGIYQYRQIALFSADDIAWVDNRLKFKGRIERDAWIKQAGKLHRKKYKSDPTSS